MNEAVQGGLPRLQRRGSDRDVLVSILVKTLNESGRIEACLRSALRAVRALPAEIIVADCLSTDDTVVRASAFPVTIVRLGDERLRSCGAGAQLAWQYARGTYVYILDGDMELLPGFLEQAIGEMERDPGIAGVGGLVEEMVISNLVFRNRAAARLAHMQPGDVDRLCQGGLYRRAAIEDAGGYFSDANLHSFEEFELGLRLKARGWRLVRLAVPAVRHFGHAQPTLELLLRRVKTGFTRGPGELLRAHVAGPALGSALREYGVFLGTLGWWLAAIAAVLVAPRSPWPLLLLLALALSAPVVMWVRKGSVAAALYAVAAWQVYAFGLLDGFLRRRRDPRARLPSEIIKSASIETRSGV
jgi:glycosyltransferase involved in cell wall biosynthesis